MLVGVLNLHLDKKIVQRVFLRIESTDGQTCARKSTEFASGALIMNNFKHRVLRIEPNNTAVQKCASRSTEFAS